MPLIHRAYILVCILLCASFLLTGCGQAPTGSTSKTNESQGTSGQAMKDSKSPAPSPRDGKNNRPAPPDTISSVELSKALTEDPKSTEQKYQGKTISVRGKLSNMGTLFDTSFRITLDCFVPPGNQVPYLLIGEFPCKAHEAFEKLVPGQEVVFRGKPVFSPGAMVLDQCELLTILGDSPALVVTAVQLTKAAAADRPAAEQKYHKKYLLLQGVVHAIETKDKNTTFLDLECFDEKAESPLRVRVHIPTGLFQDVNRERMKNVAKGKSVRVKGEADVSLPGPALPPAATHLYLHRGWLILPD